MATPCEPPTNSDVQVPAPGVAPGRGPMRMPRRQRWVPNGILAKVDEVIVPVAPPVQYQKKAVVEVKEEEEEVEVVLPEGTPLNSVAGLELPQDAIGPALEFLEFCNAFYKPLAMKIGDGEKALQEIFKGCNIKRAAQCPVVQVHVHILSVIVYETDDPCNVSCSLKGKSSWLEVLKKYLHKKINLQVKDTEMKDADDEKENELKDSETESPSKTSPSSSDSVASPSKSSYHSYQESTSKFAAALERGPDGYESLSINDKLQLLNTLCNDVLGTAVIRYHIETVIAECAEIKREKREKSLAAKKKAKLDQEKQNSKLAKMLAAGKNQGPLSEEKRIEYVAKLQAEAMKVSASKPADTKEPDTEESKALKSDAIKTEAIVWDKGARALWKLKGGNDRASIALQDITNIDGVPKENWSVYSEKDEEVLAAYLIQKKNGTHRRRPRKRYQLKTAEDFPIASVDASTDAMDITSDNEGAKAEKTLASDGEVRGVSSSSEEDSGSDHDSEPEEDPLE